MAKLALAGRRRVIGRLARGDIPVVAGPATAQYLRVIHPANCRPARRAMTVLALPGGTNVIERRCRGLYQATTIVARGTFTGRPLEYALDMTVFAIHILVRPVEWPGSGEMIKPGTEGGLRARWPDGQGKQCRTREQ
ncbi:MAG: hypothetical protein OEW88_09720 [Gammaproteobacteria bacterium]|nr:hypothetical protein [Gammaproteobacteria bacterium]MDH5276689.1 hypothetical protein [Gammaproteobacteria bacterium]